MCLWVLGEKIRWLEKSILHNKIKCDWDLQNCGERILGLRDFNFHVGRRIDLLRECMVVVCLTPSEG